VSGGQQGHEAPSRHGTRSRSRHPWGPGVTATAGAVLGVGGFAAAAVAGAEAGVHPAGPAAGVAALAAEGRSWVATVGTVVRPRHAEHSRLPCDDIALWGRGLDRASGGYQVFSEEPTGRDQTVLEGTWRYDEAKGGRQVVATISGAAVDSGIGALGAVPREPDGFHVAVRVPGAHPNETHFWIAACPAAAAAPPAPPPPRSGVSAARVHVPTTGAGGGDLEGLALVAAGGACLGTASWMRRRRPRPALPAGRWWDEGTRGHRPLAEPLAALRARLARVGACVPGRTTALVTVVAAAALATVPTGLAGGAAGGATRLAVATAGLARTAAGHLGGLVAPPPQPRVQPVYVEDAGAARGGLAWPDARSPYYAFPAGTGHTPRSGAPGR
jgi:hypothetical protein